MNGNQGCFKIKLNILEIAFQMSFLMFWKKKILYVQMFVNILKQEQKCFGEKCSMNDV